MKKKFLIFFGGSLANLIFAAYYSYKKKYKIIVIEQKKNLGGSFSPLYAHKENLDLGMRMLYSSGEKKLDTFYRKAFHKKYFSILEGTNKDRAGILWNNKYLKDSPCLNFIKYSVKEKNLILKDINKIKKKKLQTAQDVLTNRFGRYCVKKYFNKLYKKKFLNNLNLLHPVATNIIQNKRIVMFNDKYNFLKYNSKKFRDMYAISNQDNVPKNFLKKQFGIYPLNFGAFRIVDRLKKIILQNNLIIFSSPKNINFSISKKKIDSVTLTTNDGSVFNFNAYKIFWAQPINILVNLLKIKLIQTKAPSMQEYYYVYIVSSKSIAHNNYYIYDYDSRIFRITNYNSYVKEIPQKIKNLLCVEYANLKYEDVDSIKKNIISRLNLIDKKNKYKFLFVFKSKREPLPTIINIKKLLNIFKKINNLKINNLIITMPFFDGQSFYIHDVIKSIFKKIKNKI